MNRAWQKVEEMQGSWVTRERELVEKVDQLEAQATATEAALE